jgi:hypothetical protein
MGVAQRTIRSRSHGATKFIAKMEPERLASSALEIAEAARERLKAKAK